MGEVLHTTELYRKDKNTSPVCKRHSKPHWEKRSTIGFHSNSTAMTDMHATASPKPQPTPLTSYAIVTLDGKELETRPTYWTALLRAYAIAKMGSFTIEPR